MKFHPAKLISGIFGFFLLLVSSSVFAGLLAAGPGNDRVLNWWHSGVSPSGNPATLYASLENQGLWKTTDAGATWSQVGQSTLGGYVNAVYFSTAYPAAVCAAKDGVPYYSLDGGATWQLNTAATAVMAPGDYVNWFSGANGDASLRLAVVNRSKVVQNIVTLNGDGTLAGMNVTDISAGLPTGIIINGPVRLDNFGNMLLPTNQGVYVRPKNASTWSGVTSSWMPGNTGLDTSDLYVLDVRAWGSGYVAITSRNVWVMTNGSNWTSANGNLPAAPHKLWTTTDTVYNGVYVTVPGYGIFKTVDGSTWTQFQQEMPGDTALAMAIVGNSSAAAAVIGIAASGLYVANGPTASWAPAGGFTPSNGCTDASLLTAMRSAFAAYSQSDFTTLAGFLSANFLDNGQNASAWLTKMQSDRSNQPASPNFSMRLRSPVCRIAADGNSAFVTMPDTEYARCPNQTGLVHIMDTNNGSNSICSTAANTVATDGVNDMMMVKEGGQWKFAGNQVAAKVNITAGVSTDVMTGNLVPNWNSWVNYWIDDSTASYQSVTVSGPGITGTQALAFDSTQMAWQAPCGPTGCSAAMASFSSQDPTNGGSNPLTYTFTLTPKSGSPITVQQTVTGPFMTRGPILMKPQVFSGKTQFNLLMPTSENYSYAFELFTSQGTNVGNFYDVAGPSLTVPSPPAGTYNGNVQANRRSQKMVTYAAIANLTACFDGSKWTAGACSGGSTSGGTFNTSNYVSAFIGANRDMASGVVTYSISVAYPRTSGDNLVSYTLSCPGYPSVGGNLPTPSGNVDHWSQPLNFGTSKPTLPLACTSTLTNGSGQTNSKTVTIDHFNENYPLNPGVTPILSGGVTSPPVLDCANPSNAPVVTWSAPASGSYTYQAGIWTADYANQVWFAGNRTSPLNFAAQSPLPALSPGGNYKLLLASDESANGGLIFAAQLHIPFACTGTSPSGSTTTTTTTSTTTTSTSTATTTTTTLASSSSAINFVPSWNLVGNGTSGSIDVAAAFGDQNKVITVWKWVAATQKWAFYAPSLGQQLASYAANKGYDVLTTIASGEGFWVNAATSFSTPLPQATLLSSSAFQDPLSGSGRLISGWNLVATGDNKTPSLFNKALSTTPPAQGVIPLNVVTLWSWNASSMQWYFYSPDLESKGTLSSYATGKGYLDYGMTTLTPATGFWVNKP